MVEKKDNNITFFGKIAKLPRNSTPKKAVDFLEKIKISKQRLWYLIVEKQDNELQMIKYNNKLNVNLKIFVENLKDYYINDKELSMYINLLEIEGDEKFSTIKNIPDVMIGDKKLITIITEDLIKLLH